MIDDGYKSEYSIRLSTEGFTSEEVDLLMDILYRKFNVFTTKHKKRSSFDIAIQSKSADLFAENIRPFIIPHFLYKLGRSGSLDNPINRKSENPSKGPVILSDKDSKVGYIFPSLKDFLIHCGLKPDPDVLGRYNFHYIKGGKVYRKKWRLTAYEIWMAKGGILYQDGTSAPIIAPIFHVKINNVDGPVIIFKKNTKTGFYFNSLTECLEHLKVVINNRTRYYYNNTYIKGRKLLYDQWGLTRPDDWLDKGGKFSRNKRLLGLNKKV